MKIYRVVQGNGQVRSLWTSYRSANGSATQARRHADNVELQVAHVPEEMFQPVDKTEEARLARLENVWWQLSIADAELALTRLREQLDRRKGWALRTAVTPPALPDAAKLEAEALLKLDRLVDAR